MGTREAGMQSWIRTRAITGDSILLAVSMTRPWLLGRETGGRDDKEPCTAEASNSMQVFCLCLVSTWTRDSVTKLTENSWRFLPDVPLPSTLHPNSNYRRVPDTPIPLLFQIQVPPQPSKVGAECGLGAVTS